jgi:ABC-type multidrug transport system fused ATPase/permease subunit
VDGHEWQAKLSGGIAYVAQSAWIQNNTIRENILFGRAMDPIRYKEAVRVSGLESDLAQFPDRDDTEIGERGTTLSGGQKQRVQLARAVYQDADVYVLDDPFSAVDAHTGTFLFEECVMGALKDKTVILVTHQLEFLPEVDQIIVMRAPGEIVQRGTYNELVQEGKDFGAFVEALESSLHNVTRASRTSLEGEAGMEALLDSMPDTKIMLASSGNSGNFKAVVGNAQMNQVVRAGSLSRSTSGRTSNVAAITAKQPNAKLIQEEIRATGRVNSTVIWKYLSTFGKGVLWSMVLIPQSATTAFQVCSDIWLASGISTGEPTSQHFMLIYVLLLSGCSASVFIRTRFVAWIGVATAQALFTGMLNSILRAPMSFIDSTPVGRILSRSSTDQSAVDTDLPFLVAGVGNTVIGLIGTILITTYVTPKILFLALPLGYLFVRLQVQHLPSVLESRGQTFVEPSAVTSQTVLLRRHLPAIEMMCKLDRGAM